MRCWRTRVGSVLSHFIGNVAHFAGRWEEARAQPWNPVRGWHPLSTVGILGQIVTFVGAGEGRSGVGTLASPWLHRWGTGGKRQGNRTPGDPRVPTLLPCHSIDSNKIGKGVAKKGKKKENPFKRSW